MDPNPNRLMKALGLKYPLIVAPMAGGPTTSKLVVASSEAGALGSIGAAYYSPEQIRKITQEVRSETSKPIAINLFIPTPVRPIADEKLERAIEKTQKYRDELRLPKPILKAPFDEDFDRQFETVLSLRPQVLSFVFGMLSADQMKEAKKQGLLTIGTATSPAEAIRLEESGVDAIVIQGFEAGGHRGIFDSEAQDPMIPLMDLLKNLKGRIKVPMIAAGGLMKTQEIREALQAGAEAVQMGTAFLATKEAGTSAPYRQRLLQTEVRETRLTRAFSGRIARGLVNRFMQEMEEDPQAILPFPQQNKFTRDLRNAAAAAGSSDFLSLWSGMGAGSLWTGSVTELIENLFSDL